MLQQPDVPCVKDKGCCIWPLVEAALPATRYVSFSSMSERNCNAQQKASIQLVTAISFTITDRTQDETLTTGGVHESKSVDLQVFPDHKRFYSTHL